MNTNDIYHVIGVNLLHEGYHDLKDVPFETLEEHIKRYVQYKLQYHDHDLSLDELLKKLEALLTEEEKLKTMGNFIHFLLNYFSLLQEFEMVWYIEEVVEPEFRVSEYLCDKYDGLVTSKDIDYIQTFHFVLEKIKVKLEGERQR